MTTSVIQLTVHTTVRDFLFDVHFFNLAEFARFRVKGQGIYARAKSTCVVLVWRESQSCMMAIRVFSRKVLLLFLLALPRPDPLCFSAHSGRSLIPDPGVTLCFSAQSGGGDLPVSWVMPGTFESIGVQATTVMMLACLSVLLRITFHLW